MNFKSILYVHWQEESTPPKNRDLSPSHILHNIDLADRHEPLIFALLKQTLYCQQGVLIYFIVHYTVSYVVEKQANTSPDHPETTHLRMLWWQMYRNS